MDEATIITAIATVGAGAAATIKFLFSRLEASTTERMDAMDEHILELKGHIKECNDDRNMLRSALLDATRNTSELKRRVDELAPQ